MRHPFRAPAALAALPAAAALLLASAPPGAPAPPPPPPPGPQQPVPADHFQRVTLNEFPGEPMDLAVLPDSRVLHTTRSGEVWLHDPATGRNTLAAALEVYTHDEEGLQSVAVDPGFDGRANRWVYLYYAPRLATPTDDPATPGINEGDAPPTDDPAALAAFRGVNRLSRFPLVDGRLDTSREQRILDVPTDRGQCCHVGGDIAFDGRGLLYLSTGDDTAPFSSGGYAPIDERPGRSPVFDAQRTAANSADLRGKVLRLRVAPDGSPSAPEGNLFPPGTPGTRPEIYLMGLRNPFRIEVDRRTGTLLVADYSPDAPRADPERGPAGHGKWLAVREAGNHGWPYCVTPHLPYMNYDFGTGTADGPFDCAAPVNASPHNTGLRRLPPVSAPHVWYPAAESADFPALGSGGIGPMAGPVYAPPPRPARGEQPVAWPERYAGAPLLYEWTRDWIKALRLDPGTGALRGMEDVLPGLELSGPMDLEFGPEGALYALEYGKGYFAENPEARLTRIDHLGPEGNRTPVPRASADAASGRAPLTVSFSGAGSEDAEGDRLRYAWDFDADGRVDSRRREAAFTYRREGLYRATLRVTDAGGPRRGRSASAEVLIVVGNEAPRVAFSAPVAGQAFRLGDAVAFSVRVADDQPVDCARVRVDYVLGHDEHGHPQSTASGCAGVIATAPVEGHDPAHDRLAGVFVARYTDPGADGLPPLTGSAEVALIPTG
ncbi:PQQ-dependent sugar dehydrogenase [Streptomyces sp. DSM 44917]|uniref:PQQ-dependent sugar dehydrogenase n=1 Tax=Streptomyces boetiae TaxID=3075541 RepID=A0ABU2LFQ1_9ACTN|nr:PQQ-dependent sugar dehydrogenase [Streptomyces sp. DSM 44917]MDT0310063.1 PQQ-dependent sugar dehydrogenase [Streptomyces sp. DSM 44917]